MTKFRSVWLIGAVIVSIVFLTLFQTWEFAKRTPPGAVYPLVHGYMPDYYWYLSLMEQGAEGRFLLTSRYSPEQFPPQFVNTFFPIAGILARVIGLNLPMMYLLMRVVFGISLLMMGFILVTRLFAVQPERFLAFTLMIIGVPLWFWEGGILRTYGDFWAELDPIVRISYLPHHLAASTALIAVFLMLSYTFKNRKLWFGIVSGGISVLAIWLNPVSFLPIIGALVFAIVLEPQLFLRRLQPILVFLILSLLPVLALLRVEHSVFPWTAFRDWERLVSYPIDALGFLKVLGIAAIPAIMVIPRVVVKGNTLWRLVAGWFLTPIVGLGLFQWHLPISNARFLQSAAHIPTALLAAYGVTAFAHWVAKWHIPKVVTIAVALLVFLGVSMPSFSASISQQMRSVERDSRNLLIHVPEGVREAMEWLNNTGQAEEVVVAPSWVSTMIPAFTNKRVVVGHPTFTYEGSVKQSTLDRLFQLTDPEESRRILDMYNVTYVWAESPSRAPDAFFREIGLSPIFTNSVVTIYRTPFRS